MIAKIIGNWTPGHFLGMSVVMVMGLGALIVAEEQRVSRPHASAQPQPRHSKTGNEATTVPGPDSSKASTENHHATAQPNAHQSNTNTDLQVSRSYQGNPARKAQRSAASSQFPQVPDGDSETGGDDRVFIGLGTEQDCSKSQEHSCDSSKKNKKINRKKKQRIEE